jgi:hypothetical protein
MRLWTCRHHRDYKYTYGSEDTIPISYRVIFSLCELSELFALSNTSSSLHFNRLWALRSNYTTQTTHLHLHRVDYVSNVSVVYCASNWRVPCRALGADSTPRSVLGSEGPCARYMTELGVAEVY